MALPQTASLSISASSFDRGFTVLPFGLGFTWFEEMDYDVSGDRLNDDDPRRLRSLKRSTMKLCELIDSLLPRQESGMAGEDEDGAGWIPERIFLFGFSAGACLAMEACLRIIHQARQPLGGAVCVAGGLKCDPTLGSKLSTSTLESRYTPILIVAGSNDGMFPSKSAITAAKLYDLEAGSSFVQIFIKEGKVGTFYLSCTLSWIFRPGSSFF